MSCELPEWCNDVERTCRGRSKEPLKCCECRGEIQKGHRYVECKGVWNGDFETFRFHKLCHDLVRERDGYLRQVCGLYENEVPGFGELINSSREDACEGGGDCAWWPKELPMTREALAEAAILASTKEAMR